MRRYKQPFRVNIKRGVESLWIQRDGDKEWQEFVPYWWSKPLFGSMRMRAQKKFLLSVEQIPMDRPKSFRVRKVTE